MPGHGGRILGHDACQDALGRGGLEGCLSGQCLIENTAKGVDVRTPIQGSGPRGLLGTHVADGAHHQTRGRQAILRVPVHDIRDSEVGDHRLTVLQQHVLGLHVPMDQTLTVSVVESLRRLGHDSDRIGHGQRAFPLESIPQGAAGHVGHDVPSAGIGPRELPRVENGQDVGVTQPGNGADLTLKPLCTGSRGDAWREDLDGNLAAVAWVDRQEDRGHATPTELALHVVATRKTGPDLLQ